MKSCLFVGAVVAVAGSFASADIVIDSFNDLFAAEEFVGSASNGVIHSTYMSSGLEIGFLGLANGAEVGDAFTYTPRIQEIQHQMGLAGVLGGSRYGELNASDPANLGSRVSANMYGGMMAYSTAFGTQGILDLRYDANGNGLDTDVSGHNAVSFDLISGDLDSGFNPRPVPFSITLTSALGTASEASWTVSDFLLVDQNYSFDLADYAANGVDLGDIDSVLFHVDQSAPHLAAVDFTLGQIAFVPAPGVGMLLGLAGLGVCRRRR